MGELHNTRNKAVIRKYRKIENLASADFPGPVIKERYTFISLRAKRTLDEIIELKIKLKNL